MYASMALEILWKIGRSNFNEFIFFKSYIDSLAKVKDKNEIEELADFVNNEYNSIDGLGKSSNMLAYKDFKSSKVSANVLLSNIEYNFIQMNDENKAMQAFNIMKSEFAKEPETTEAAILLGLGDNYFADESNLIPAKYELAQNYPNPFNSATTFKFGLPVISNVKIQIFNTIGQNIKTIQLKNVVPGYHTQVWDGNNNLGNIVASGMYLYKFTAAAVNNQKHSFTKTRKMLLIK
jgi:FlgD Ig-like domain